MSGPIQNDEYKQNELAKIIEGLHTARPSLALLRSTLWKIPSPWSKNPQTEGGVYGRRGSQSKVTELRGLEGQRRLLDWD